MLAENARGEKTNVRIYLLDSRRQSGAVCIFAPRRGVALATPAKGVCPPGGNETSDGLLTNVTPHRKRLHARPWSVVKRGITYKGTGRRTVMPLSCRALPEGPNRALAPRTVDVDFDSCVQQYLWVPTVLPPRTHHFGDDLSDERLIR